MSCPIECLIKIEDGRAWITLEVPAVTAYIRLDDELSAFIMSNYNSTRFKFKPYIDDNLHLRLDFIDQVGKETIKDLIDMPPMI